MAPALLVLVLLNALPLLWSFGMSFYRFRADRPHTPPRFIGLDNYLFQILNADVWESAQHTAVLTGGSVVVQMVMGGVLAWAFYRPFPGRRFVLMLVLAPMLLSTVAVGTFFNLFYDPTFGIFSAVVRLFTGAPFVPLATPTSAMLSLIAADAWMWSPFVMLMLLAGLDGTPAHLLEAAEIDRAAPWQRFRAVIFPAIRGVLLLAVLFRLIASFNQFELVFTITNGGPGTSTETLSTEVYGQAFVLFQTGRAAALTNIGTFVVVVLVQLYFHALRQRDPDYIAAWERGRALAPPRGAVARLSRRAQLLVVTVGMPLVAGLLVGVPWLLRHFRVPPRLIVVPPPPGSAAAVQGWATLETAPADTTAWPGGAALAVPDGAVLFEPDGARVWVVGADGVPAPRAVKLGRIAGGSVEILDGLSAGETVVTRGALFLDRAWKGY